MQLQGGARRQKEAPAERASRDRRVGRGENHRRRSTLRVEVSGESPAHVRKGCLRLHQFLMCCGSLQALSIHVGQSRSFTTGGLFSWPCNDCKESQLSLAHAAGQGQPTHRGTAARRRSAGSMVLRSQSPHVMKRMSWRGENKPSVSSLQTQHDSNVPGGRGRGRKVAPEQGYQGCGYVSLGSESLRFSMLRVVL